MSWLFYTIQGWLKGVNSQSLTPGRDPGRDGDSGGLHAWVGRDAFGFSLHYFPGDYHPTGDIPPDSMFLGGMDDAPFWEDSTAVPDSNQYRALYNGNIAARAIHHQGLGGGDPRLTAYTYDQLNRLWASETYTGYDSAQNHWNDASPQPDYKTRYRYDLNGNLTQLDRMDGQATPGLMDKLTYHYQAGTNRLTHVEDATAANYADEASHGVRDFDGHSGPNYAYDRTGNLIADTAEHIRRIRWNVAGKVTAVERDTIKPDRAALDFRYGPDGRRLRKRVKRRPEQSHWTTTYYVRDAQGHPMATYHKRAFVVADTMGIPEVTAYLLDSLGLDSTAGLLQSQLSGQADYLDLLEAEVLDLDDQQKDNLLGRYSVGQFLDWDVTLYNSLLQGYPASDAGELYQYGLDQQSAATYATVYTCLHPGGPEGILEAIFNGPYPESIYNCALNLGMLWLIEEAYLNLYGAPPPSWMPHSQMVQDINMMPAADRAAVTASLIDEVLFETLVSCNPNVLPSFMQSYDANGNTYESRFPAALVSCDEAEHFHTYLHDQHGGAVGGDAYHNLLLNEAGNSYLVQLLRDQSNRFIKHSLLETNLTNPQLINQPLLNREDFFLQEYLSLVRDAVGEGPLFEGLQQRIVPFLRFREEWKLEAFYLYGSKRLGTMQLDSTLHAREFSISGFDSLGRFVVDSVFVDSTARDAAPQQYAAHRGRRRFELTDHLGNVQSVVSDAKIAVEDGATPGTLAYYQAQVLQAGDYYPFGMKLPGNVDKTGYRFGFQGQEADGEVYGDGNVVAYKYRMHDARLGRFFSIDPLFRDYPHNSTYAFSENRVVDAVELEGMESADFMNRWNEEAFILDKITYQELRDRQQAQAEGALFGASISFSLGGFAGLTAATGGRALFEMGLETTAQLATNGASFMNLDIFDIGIKSLPLPSPVENFLSPLIDYKYGGTDNLDVVGITDKTLSDATIEYFAGELTGASSRTFKNLQVDPDDNVESALQEGIGLVNSIVGKSSTEQTKTFLAKQRSIAKQTEETGSASDSGEFSPAVGDDGVPNLLRRRSVN